MLFSVEFSKQKMKKRERKTLLKEDVCFVKIFTTRIIVCVASRGCSYFTVHAWLFCNFLSFNKQSCLCNSLSREKLLKEISSKNQ